MANIDRAYVALALVLLLVGELLGYYMGVTSDLTYRSVHITIVLPGFVTLSIFGGLYRLWPQMKQGPLAAVQFWLGALGALGLIAGAYQIVTTGGVAVAAVAAAATILAVLLLLFLFLSRSGASAKSA